MPTIVTEQNVHHRWRATYQDVLEAPEDMIAEIIGDELHLQPRPAPRHSDAQAGLIEVLRGPYRRGIAGPGRWILLVEPEVHVDKEVLVPDLAGWHMARLPTVPDCPFIDIAPNWVCEILSPSTRAKDVGPKRETYARVGVNNLWHVDPSVLTLETFELQAGRWLVGPTFRDSEPVRAAPFADVEFALDALWPERTAEAAD